MQLHCLSKLTFYKLDILETTNYKETKECNYNFKYSFVKKIVIIQKFSRYMK